MRTALYGLTALALLAGTHASSAAVLQLDVGVSDNTPPNSTTPNEVQSGFTSFEMAANGSGGGGDESNSTSLSDTQTFSGISVTFTAAEAGFVQPDPGGLPVHVEYRDRPGEVTTTSPDVANLVEDFVFARNGPLTLTLSGLSAGEYTMTTYHHDPQFGGYTAGPIAVDTGAGPTEVAGGGVAVTTGFGDAASPVTPSSRTFGFITTGGDVNIIFNENPDTAQNPTLNGFVLDVIPEPGTGLLALLGVPVILRRRRR